MQVIEDTGSANNWISREQVKRLRLSVLYGDEITIETITGEKYSSDTFVDISWTGKGSHQGTDRFYEAPKGTPITMLVGNEFIDKHPGVFEEEEPITFHLLTLQSREKASEQRSWNNVSLPEILTTSLLGR